MFKDKLIGALKDKKSIDNNDDKEMVKAINKIQEQRRLSSQEFLSIYNSLWKAGPTVKYQNPDAQVRQLQSNKWLPKPINFEEGELK
jgi:hypothetical protein